MAIDRAWRRLVCSKQSVLVIVLVTALTPCVTSAPVEPSTAPTAAPRQHLSAAPFQEYGVVSPADPFEFEGQRVQLNCTIKDPGQQRNSSNLFFVKKTTQGKKTLETDLIQVHDWQTISVTLLNVSVEDEGAYTCLLRSDSPGEQHTVIGHQILQVDYKPQPVQNVTCEVYNWQEMNCEWQLGVTFNHPENIKVDVYYAVADESFRCLKTTKTSCQWDQSTYQHVHHYWVQVDVIYQLNGRVRTKSKKLFGIETQLYETTALDSEHPGMLTVQALVRPAEVQNLTGWAESDSCILLSWRYPWEEYTGKTFVGQVMPSSGEDRWKDIILNVTSEDIADRYSRQSLVCNLQPHNLYSFRVAVDPFDRHAKEIFRQGHRSEWRETSILTEQGVPDAAPQLCPGCFYEIQDDSKKKNVKVIWKDIPKASRRGKLTHYNVIYTGLATGIQHSVQSQLSDNGAPQTSVQLNLPSRTEDFQVEIRGATIAGVSPMSASMIIPSLGSVPAAVPNDIKQMWVERSQPENKALRLFYNWTLPPTDSRRRIRGSKTSTFLIVWCKGSRLDYRCEESVGWMELPLRQLTFVHDTELAEFDPNDLLIGIATTVKAGQDSLSSGLVWNPCLYAWRQIPRASPSNLRVFPNDSARGLTVVWDKHGCLEEPSRVLAYLVRYRFLQSEDGFWHEKKDKKVKVTGEVTEVVLPNLVKGRIYRISVAALSSAGPGPENVKNFTFTGSKETGPPGSSTPIILGVLGVLGCAAIGLFLAVRCYKKRKKLIDLEDFIDFSLPENTNGNMVREPSPQASDSSGEGNHNSSTPLLEPNASAPREDSRRLEERRNCRVLVDPVCEPGADNSAQRQPNGIQSLLQLPPSSTSDSVGSYQVMGVSAQDIPVPPNEHCNDASQVTTSMDHTSPDFDSETDFTRSVNFRIPAKQHDVKIFHLHEEDALAVDEPLKLASKQTNVETQSSVDLAPYVFKCQSSPQHLGSLPNFPEDRSFSQPSGRAPNTAANLSQKINIDRQTSDHRSFGDAAAMSHPFSQVLTDTKSGLAKQDEALNDQRSQAVMEQNSSSFLPHIEDHPITVEVSEQIEEFPQARHPSQEPHAHSQNISSHREAHSYNSGLSAYQEPLPQNICRSENFQSSQESNGPQNIPPSRNTTNMGHVRDTEGTGAPQVAPCDERGGNQSISPYLSHTEMKQM
ncbi:hypothetical protein RRG08_029479 [Elysia crispata]|uniref:Uncharacterized protein n=1 Tax=Elysia crispata TaxID=231223 RepID=A0AAE1B2M2_9GAST|nr:hypothetical protein RRG08_029479 [Elysia crispata]